MVKPASRILWATENSFRDLTELKQKLRRDGLDFIDLSEGDPDLPPPAGLRDKLSIFCRQVGSHSYSTRRGIAPLREAILHFMAEEFGVPAGPIECLPASGSKELIAHVCQALVDPGDLVLVPSLHYPIYRTAVQYAGGDLATYPLEEDRGYRPRVDQVPLAVLDRARLLWLNYPHNPTGATVSAAEVEAILGLCAQHDIIVAVDLAYSHLVYDEEATPSALSTGYGCRNVVELHSLSKSLLIPGWRAGFAVGDPRIIDLIERSKAVFDTGMFIAIQKAIRYGLHHFAEFNAAIRETYRERADYIMDELNRIGIVHVKPRGTLYIWCGIPGNATDRLFTERLLREARPLVMPGSAFGRAGDRHFRLALTQPIEVLSEAMVRLRRFVTSDGYDSIVNSGDSIN